VQNNIENITMALAGMLQAIALVREVAQTGKTNDTAFQASIFSLFQINPTTSACVYGGISGVKLGLEKLIHTFDTSHGEDRMQSRYLLSLIHLQKKLKRNPAMLDKISQRLKQAQKQVDYFSLTHATVIANLADIYLNTISTFKFRIIILGNQRILNVRENMDKVRALLLAGVRSAVLWQQVGGNRIQILFFRAKIKACAEKLLAEINQLQPSIEKDIL
jgi:high frequency lysogenization protein